VGIPAEAGTTSALCRPPEELAARQPAIAWGLLERDHSFRRLLQYGFERHNALCHKALQRLSALSFFTLLLGELLQNDVPATQFDEFRESSGLRRSSTQAAARQ